jgi:hypothetical protein
MMLDELERRNYSQSTVRTYVKTIEDLARYFKRPPDQLGPDQLRQYQAYLFRERKLAPNNLGSTETRSETNSSSMPTGPSRNSILDSHGHR